MTPMTLAAFRFRACHSSFVVTQGQPVAGFFTHIYAHFSAIDPISDTMKADTLHRISNKLLMAAAALLLVMPLAACQPAAESPVVNEQQPANGERGCGDNGRLSTTLYGSIAREISWSAGAFRCESMLRPEGKGVRLRFIGDIAENELSIILALPELRPGATNPESPTVVTLTVDGSGRFFTTPTLESCWSDILAQDPVGAGDSRYAISGTLYCVAPLGEINGDAAISIPEMAFRGIVDWSAK